MILYGLDWIVCVDNRIFRTKDRGVKPFFNKKKGFDVSIEVSHLVHQSV